MARYSKKASQKIEKVMHEQKKGKLRTSAGKKVTSRKQAIAIGISEAKQEGFKVPEKKKAAKKIAKKKTVRKAAPKKKAAKKSARKKTAS